MGARGEVWGGKGGRAGCGRRIGAAETSPFSAVRTSDALFFPRGITALGTPQYPLVYVCDRRYAVQHGCGSACCCAVGWLVCGLAANGRIRMACTECKVGRITSRDRQQQVR